MYNPTKWQDHITDPKNEYLIEPIEGDRYKITHCGEILKRGTLLSAENLNKTELALFKTVTTLGSMFQNLQLQKDYIEANYNELMRQKIELENQKNKLDSNCFFVTDEYTVESSDFDYQHGSKLISKTIDFGKNNYRKNENYFAIPFITETNPKTNEGGNDYVSYPLMHLSTNGKSKTGCCIEILNPDPLSYIGTYKFRVLVIGGV